MKTRFLNAPKWFLMLLLLGGCASPDHNQSTPRTGRGYVDLFTDPKEDVWWKVDVFDAAGGNYKEFTAQFEAPAGGILRVEAKPGSHKARISLVNRALEAPADIEVVVRDGMVTPVRVKLEPAGTSYVRTVEDRGNAVVRNKVTDEEHKRWKLAVTTEPPRPYATKENSAYWK